MIQRFKSNIISKLKDKHFSEILTGSILSFGVKISTVILGLITNLLIAKYYGAEVLGILALLMSVMSITTMLSLIGLDVAILRFIPPFFIKHEYNNIRHIVNNSFIIFLSFVTILSFIIYFFSNYISIYIFEKPYLSSLISLISYFIIFQVIIKFNTATIRALKNIKIFLLLQFLPSFINLALLFLITFLLYNHYNPIYTQLATQLIVALISLLFLKKHLSSLPKKDSNNTITIKELIQTSFPMFLTTAMQMVVLQTDVLMLSKMSTLENVGIYSIVMKLALLSSFIITSINTILAPKFSELFYSKQYDTLQKISKQSTKLIFYATLPVILILIIFSEQLLSLFGTKFIIGTSALILLAIGQLINAMAGSVGYFLNMTGHQKIFNKIILIGGTSNIILNMLLIPTYGINGAAFASMISMILWNILASIFIKKEFGFYIGYIPIISLYYSNKK